MKKIIIKDKFNGNIIVACYRGPKGAYVLDITEQATHKTIFMDIAKEDMNKLVTFLDIITENN